ncbi:MAG: hypothetical protein ACRD29_25395, partial [Acidimicrobiales bacterium]
NGVRVRPGAGPVDPDVPGWCADDVRVLRQAWCGRHPVPGSAPRLRPTPGKLNATGSADRGRAKTGATRSLERVVFDGPSRVIDVGPHRRLFDVATRRSVEVRDRECFHPS